MLLPLLDHSIWIHDSKFIDLFTLFGMEFDTPLHNFVFGIHIFWCSLFFCFGGVEFECLFLYFLWVFSFFLIQLHIVLEKLPTIMSFCSELWFLESVRVLVASRLYSWMDELVGPRLYSCYKCRNHVCLHDDIISKAFQVKHLIFFC